MADGERKEEKVDGNLEKNCKVKQKAGETSGIIPILIEPYEPQGFCKFLQRSGESVWEDKGY